MPEITEYVQEKLDWIADKVREFLTGSGGYRVREVREPVPDVRKVLRDRLAQPVSPSDAPCDKY